MTTERTPSPWDLQSKGWDGNFICANDERVGGDNRRLIAEVSLMYDGAEANAEFIVRACNAHDDLVTALQHCDMRLTAMVGMYELCADEIQGSIDVVRAALIKAQA